MADVAMSMQEAFPGAGSYSENGASAKLATTFERYAQWLGYKLRKSRTLENRMETYRYSVASRVPFHCEHI